MITKPSTAFETWSLGEEGVYITCILSAMEPGGRGGRHLYPQCYGAWRKRGAPPVSSALWSLGERGCITCILSAVELRLEDLKFEGSLG